MATIVRDGGAVWRFAHVSQDKTGRWGVRYFRRDPDGEHNCWRAIWRDEGEDRPLRHFRGHERPTGGDLLATCAAILGRMLTPLEESDLLQLRCIG